MLGTLGKGDAALRLVFWIGDKAYEKAVSGALKHGAKLHGDKIEIRAVKDYNGPDGDAGIMCGMVKDDLIQSHKRANKPFLYIDKGYKRERSEWNGDALSAWWRAIWNNTHPTEYLNDITRPSDRWDKLEHELKDRNDGETILIAGSSKKYHLAHGLLHPTLWTQNLIAALRVYTDRPIVYRPKPSWRDAEKIKGAEFDFGLKRSIQSRVEEAHCVVTHGSMASVEAICAGTPVLTIGHSVARPIGSTLITEIEDPFWADKQTRKQWAANLAYFHWSPLELNDGTAWQYIKEQFAYAPK